MKEDKMLIWKQDNVKPDEFPEAFIDFLRREGIVKELQPVEIRNIINNQKKQLDSTKDEISRKCLRAFIAGLECVLND